MGNENLYVDLDGHIWKGYINSESTMHFAKLSGTTNGLNAGVIQPIWILERSELERSWILIGQTV